MPLIRLLSRGQLTLPAAVRHQLGLEEGDEILCFINGEGQIVLEPQPKVESLWQLRGSIADGQQVDLDMREIRRQAAMRRAAAWAENEESPDPEDEMAATLGGQS